MRGARVCYLEGEECPAAARSRASAEGGSPAGAGFVLLIGASLSPEERGGAAAGGLRLFPDGTRGGRGSARRPVRAFPRARSPGAPAPAARSRPRRGRAAARFA